MCITYNGYDGHKIIITTISTFFFSADTKPLTEAQRKRIEQLKSRPRRRPDWSDLCKEVEQGKKLRHVQCNDRSAPIVSVVKKADDEDKGQVR